MTSGPSSSGSSRSGDSNSLLYSEWSTINATELCEVNSKSVLYKLRNNINGQGVVDSVVKSLVACFNSHQGISANTSSHDAIRVVHHQHPSFEYLQTDRDVQWVMEVICYGLSLPITSSEQHEGVRDCVRIYCEWMFAVLPPKSSADKLIPFPIRDDANRYFRLMIQHLFNVFVRRPNHGSSSSAVSSADVSSSVSSSASSSTLTDHHRNSNAVNLSGKQSSDASTSSSNANNASSNDFNLSDVTSRQAVLCHRILRTLEAISSDESNCLDSESWDHILIFLLGINDVLLSGPVDKEDIGTNLCDRIVKSLFEIWLISCQRYFPSPSFWKTFHELCLKIRHRSPVIDHWSIIVLALTQRLVELSYHHNQSSNQGNNTSSTSSGIDKSLSSSTLTSGSFSCNTTSSLFPVLNLMNFDVVSQTWFRFLHILGNPVDLCLLPTTSYQYSSYPVAAVTSSLMSDNFKRAMKGVSSVINTFLGNAISDTILTNTPSPVVTSSTTTNVISPSVPRKLSATSSSSSSTSTTKISSASSSSKTHLNLLQTLAGRGSSHSGQHHHQQQQQSSNAMNTSQPPVISLPTPSGHQAVTSSLSLSSSSNFKLSANRPKVNSVLASLGNWLFSASLVGTELFRSADSLATSLAYQEELERRRKSSSGSFSSSNLSNVSSFEFEAGQSEAVGVLCRLISSKKTDEEISPVYLARFYLVIQSGLTINKDNQCPRPLVLMSILMNSQRLFHLDLNGVNILIPHFIRALEFVVGSDSRSSLLSYGYLFISHFFIPVRGFQS